MKMDASLRAAAVALGLLLLTLAVMLSVVAGGMMMEFPGIAKVAAIFPLVIAACLVVMASKPLGDAIRGHW